MLKQTTRRSVLSALGAGLLAAATPSSRTLRLPLRSRVEAFKGSGIWSEVRFEKDFPVSGTAVLICDMWDNHWCTGAVQRVNALVKVMALVDLG